ncbi:MAG: hypothetical protein FJ291_04095 [Planctomycetes bacterium]|nr:hypothetical protein [Planctomycetota bacterium]
MRLLSFLARGTRHAALILFSRVTRHASFLLFALAASSIAGEGAGDAEAALRVIRQVALDRSEADAPRANAVLACARLLMASRRHDEAMKLCDEVLKTFGEKSAVADAALRAGCMVERHRHGHLKAELAFVSSWTIGTHGQTASAMAHELSRAAAVLGALAGRPMVPAPAVPRLPHWAEAAPGKPPWVLSVPPLAAPVPGWYPAGGRASETFRIALPRFEPPYWSSRLAFPPLK